MEICHYMEEIKGQPAWLLFLISLGMLTVLKLSVSVFIWIYVSFLRPGKNLKSYGSWAVVTGATDGIGKSFALQFARKGLNLVLVGRNPEKLRDVSTSISEKFGSKIAVETVEIDFSGDLVAGVERLKKKIDGLDVGLLVNNAGVSYPYARFFHELDAKLLENIMKVNVEGMTRVTHTVLPGMLKKKKGAIVNIGSGAAIIIPSDPLYAVYAASKA